MEELEYHLQDAIDEIQNKMDESVHELELAADHLRNVSKQVLDDIQHANEETARIAKEVRESHKLISTSDLRKDIDDISNKLDRLMKILNTQ